MPCTDDFSRQVARYFPATAKVVGTRQIKNLSCTPLNTVSIRVKFSQIYEKITASFGVDYFLHLPLYDKNLFKKA